MKICFELGGNSAFEDLRQEWEVGDGTVIVRAVMVESRFFEDGCDSGEFEGRRDRTSRQGGVYYGEDKRLKGRETSFGE